MENKKKKSQSGIYGSIRLNKQKYLDELVKLNAEGYNDTQVSDILKISVWSASTWRRQLGLKSNFKYKHSFNTEKFKELYDEGLTWVEIARKLNISGSTAQQYGTSLGLKSHYLEYSDTSFSKEEFQVFLGTMYGDGWLSKSEDSKNVRGGWAHSLKQKSYCQWKYEKLKRFCSKPVKVSQYDKRTEKTYFKIRISILANPLITSYYDKLYHPKKYINKELINLIEPLGLAVWFMDDGCYDHGSYSLATNNFSIEDIELIREVFKNKFNLTFTRYKSGVIRFSKKSGEIFKNLVLPYIHSDCFYKLHIDPPKTPLNGETPNIQDNPVLNPQEIEENA